MDSHTEDTIMWIAAAILATAMLAAAIRILWRYRVAVSVLALAAAVVAIAGALADSWTLTPES